MEVRFERMVLVWDDKMGRMLVEFMKVVSVCESEEELRGRVKEFGEKEEVEKLLV